MPYHDAEFQELQTFDPAAAIENQMIVVMQALESGSVSGQPPDPVLLHLALTRPFRVAFCEANTNYPLPCTRLL